MWIDGTDLGSHNVGLPGTVTPGNTASITLNLTAPYSLGGVKSWWILQDASGNRFGEHPYFEGTVTEQSNLAPVPEQQPESTQVPQQQAVTVVPTIDEPIVQPTPHYDLEQPQASEPSAQMDPSIDPEEATSNASVAFNQVVGTASNVVEIGVATVVAAKDTCAGLTGTMFFSCTAMGVAIDARDAIVDLFSELFESK